MTEMYRITTRMMKNVRMKLEILFLEMELKKRDKGVFFREDLLENYLSYDGFFLDIDMQGMNGIDTGKSIRLIDRDVKLCM